MAAARELALISSRREGKRLRWLVAGLVLTVSGLLFVAMKWRELIQSVDEILRSRANLQLETIAELRNRIAELSKSETGRVQVNRRDGLRYVFVSPGEFRMGCSDGDSECDPQEPPAHTVRITQGFWMGQTEVTQAAYERLMGINPSIFKGPDRPVEYVTWGDGQEYCGKAGMRLPTEAQWEYAGRAGFVAALYGSLDEIASYKRSTSEGTLPVANKKPNAWGLYDMVGNVREWTSDPFSPSYYSEKAGRTAVDPMGPAMEGLRVVRGGSWNFLFPKFLRISYRDAGPIERSNAVGFRCAGQFR